MHEHRDIQKTNKETQYMYRNTVLFTHKKKERKKIMVTYERPNVFSKPWTICFQNLQELKKRCFFFNIKNYLKY